MRTSHRSIPFQHRTLRINRPAGRVPKSHRQFFIQFNNTFSLPNDILIVTGGIKNNKKNIFNCLDRLNNKNLAINLNKCHFAKNKMKLLDYEINEKDLKPTLFKTLAILNLQPPTSHNQFK